MARVPTSHAIVAALIRRGDEVLLVRQQGPSDPDTSWALPGGVVEHGELLDAALEELARLPSRVMREPLIAYLRGEAKLGAVWLYRRGERGDDVLALRLGLASV